MTSTENQLIICPSCNTTIKPLVMGKHLCRCGEEIYLDSPLIAENIGKIKKISFIEKLKENFIDTSIIIFSIISMIVLIAWDSDLPELFIGKSELGWNIIYLSSSALGVIACFFIAIVTVIEKVKGKITMIDVFKIGVIIIAIISFSLYTFNLTDFEAFK